MAIRRSGTFDFTTPITGSITLKAVWNINTYTVTFDTDEGTVPSTEEVSYGDKVTEPTTDPIRTGYTFAGWQLEGETTAFDFNTPITGNITLKAIWNINTIYSNF